MTTAAETVDSISRKIFLKRAGMRPWAGALPGLQVIANQDINRRRQEKEVLRMTALGESVEKAQRWKWDVDMEAPNAADGGFYAEGAAFAFNARNRRVPGEADVVHRFRSVEIPTSRIDVRAQASDNENGVNYVVKELDSSRHQFLKEQSDTLFATATPANGFEPLNVLIDSTGTASNLAQGTHANWASQETDLAGARLTISRLRKDIRVRRAQKLASLDVAFMGFGVYDLIAQEAEAKALPTFDITEVFGKDAEDRPLLTMESSYDVFRVSNTILIPDPSLDATTPGTAFVVSLEDIFMKTVNRNTFMVKGFEDVSISDAKDASRALILWNGFTGIYNRATHIKYVNAQTS